MTTNFKKSSTFLPQKKRNQSNNLSYFANLSTENLKNLQTTNFFLEINGRLSPWLPIIIAALVVHMEFE